MRDILQVISRTGELFAWGYDLSKTMLAITPTNKYTFTADLRTSTYSFENQAFSKVFEPTKVILKLNATNSEIAKSVEKRNGVIEYSQFRNVISGVYATIAITWDKKIIAWGLKIMLFFVRFFVLFIKNTGKNPYNMLGVENYDSKEEYVFPARFVSEFGNLEDIRQINVGEKHTLILKKDNTVWGIGTNEGSFFCLFFQENGLNFVTGIKKSWRACSKHN